VAKVITQNQLLMQLVQLQSVVIALLMEALDSGGLSLPQMVRILSTSSSARTGALVALSGQYERMMEVRPRMLETRNRVQEIMETEHNPLPTRIPAISFDQTARLMSHMKGEMCALQACFEKNKKSLVAHTTKSKTATAQSMSSGLNCVEKQCKSAVKHVPNLKPLSMSAVKTIRSLKPLHVRPYRSLRNLKNSITAKTATARTVPAKLLVKLSIKHTAGGRSLNALRINLAKLSVMPSIKAIPNLKLQLKWNAFVQHSLKVRGKRTRWTKNQALVPKGKSSKTAKPASRSNPKGTVNSRTRAQRRRLKKGASQLTERVHKFAIRKAR
jgi:hypothetical protein